LEDKQKSKENDKYFKELPTTSMEVMIQEVDASKPVCATCRIQEGDEWVVCFKCKTPHHKDCWEYCGCAVYGCKGGSQDRWEPKNGEEIVYIKE
jgi:hypothetical protein